MHKSRIMFATLLGGIFLSLVAILWGADLWLYRSFQQDLDHELVLFHSDGAQPPFPSESSEGAGRYQAEQKTGWPWGASRVLYATSWHYETPTQHGEITASQLIIGGNWLQWAWNWFSGRGVTVYSPYSFKASLSYKDQTLALKGFKTRLYIRSYTSHHPHYQIIFRSALLSSETPSIEGRIVFDRLKGKCIISPEYAPHHQRETPNSKEHNVFLTVDLHSKTARLYSGQKAGQATLPFTLDGLPLSRPQLHIILNSNSSFYLAPFAVSLPLYTEKGQTSIMPRLSFTGQYNLVSHNGSLVLSLSHWRAGLSALLASPALQNHLPSAEGSAPPIQGLNPAYHPSSGFQQAEHPLTLEIPIINGTIQIPSLAQWQDVIGTLRSSLER